MFTGTWSEADGTITLQVAGYSDAEVEGGKDGTKATITSATAEGKQTLTISYTNPGESRARNVTVERTVA